MIGIFGVSNLLERLFLSAILRNCILCRDRWYSDVTPKLDAALLCSSRAGADWVVSPDWFEEFCQLGFLIRCFSEGKIFKNCVLISRYLVRLKSWLVKVISFTARRVPYNRLT